MLSSVVLHKLGWTLADVKLGWETATRRLPGHVHLCNFSIMTVPIWSKLALNLVEKYLLEPLCLNVE